MPPLAVTMLSSFVWGSGPRIPRLPQLHLSSIHQKLALFEIGLASVKGVRRVAVHIFGSCAAWLSQLRRGSLWDGAQSPFVDLRG